MRLLFLAVTLSAGCATASQSIEKARSPLQRDLEGYAIASCLVQLNEPYLKDQGDGWASVIIQRSKCELGVLTALTDVVKAEVGKGGMAIIRDETRPNADKELPVLYCSEIIDAPTVRDAIARAAEQAKASYGE